MVSIGRIVAIGLILTIIAGAAWVMNAIFGLVGVGLLVAFLVPILAVLAFFGDFGGTGSGGGTGKRRKRSKGARNRDR